MTDPDQYKHMPARKLLLQVERELRVLPAGTVAGIPRGRIADALRELRTALNENDDERWTPFEPAYIADMSGDESHVKALARSTGYSEEVVREELRRLSTLEHWRNAIYQVALRRIENEVEGEPGLVHLSIKRNDQRAIRDWRHFQRIKNEILGEEYEAVELYPAESRLADSANQYHLWAVDRPDYRWPFGFGERLVLTDREIDGTGSVQRPTQEVA